MRKYIILIVLLLPIFVKAQSISGFVKDSINGVPLSGVNLVIDNKGVVTDTKGYFSIERIPYGKYILSITCVGYKKFQKVVNLSEDAINSIEVLMVKDEIYLDEVVVSATRTENRISQIPGRVNMITSDKLSLMASQNIDEYLMLLPGVQVSRSFGIFSTKSSVTMRGLSGNEQARTLILLDGIPVNKADGGSVNWNLISTGQIEKIEVVKGPGSALYGGNAMGGVINIITLKPKKSFDGNLSVDEGTYNTHTMRLNLGGKLGTLTSKGFYWNANTFYCKSDGYITQSIADQKANPFIVASNVNEKSFNFKTGYLNSEKFNAEIDFSLYDGIRGTGEKVYQPNGNQTEYLTYQVRANLNGTVGKVRWNTSLFLLNENYKKVNEWYKDDYTWYNVLSERRDLGLLSGGSYTKGNHSFTSGFDIRNGQVDASDIYYTATDQVDNNGKMNFYGIYFQDDITLPYSFKILLGLRYDFARYYDGSFLIKNPSAETNYLDQYQFSGLKDEKWGAFSPRLSLQYRPNESFKIYGGYSRGFRPSVLDDLCRSGRIKGGLKVANPNLKPEYLNNFELGGDLIPMRALKISASTYYSKGTDFLYYVSTGDSIDMGFGERPIMIRSNISNVDIYGAEFDFSYSIISAISVFGNYAYTNAKISGYKPLFTNDPNNLEGKYLTDVPQHSFAFGSFVKTRYINTGITCKYSGSMYVNDQNGYDDIVLSNKYPSWFTVDLKLSFILSKYFNESIIIQNLLDKKIYDSKGAVCPGRFVMLQLSVKI